MHAKLKDKVNTHTIIVRDNTLYKCRAPQYWFPNPIHFYCS